MASTPKGDAPPKNWIALLGRRDTPTDGVEDYCSCLAYALERRGVHLRKARADWSNEGWVRALWRLWKQSAGWRGSWVLLQYTAMAWSRRGFPFGALAALTILRRRGVRCAVVFHEPVRQDGAGRITRLRGACQEWVIRRLYSRATKAIFADPLENIPWLRDGASKAAFVPIGANIPEPRLELASSGNRNGECRTVAVFCLSDPPNVYREIDDISYVMRSLAQHVKARVVFLGRGTMEAKDHIARALDSAGVEIVNMGIQPAAEVSRILAESDAMLCVRGTLYPRRGSAVAGIACGLPVVAYAGPIEGSPFEEAGVELAPYLDREALAKALKRVLTDSVARARLREMSLSAQKRHFSWDVIALRLLTALSSDSTRAQE